MMNAQELENLSARVSRAVQQDRLLATARTLIDIPSPTGEAGAVSDRLAEMLADEGFDVSRASGGYPAAPAVVVRLKGKSGGKRLQFDGHLDTVHLPFVPSTVEGDLLKGSGASDMKAGVVAAVEALRVIRELDLVPVGEILLTAHDLHEAPWGDGSQHENMIREGIHGDAVLIPEYTTDYLPVIGRGNSVFKIVVKRAGSKVHEVYRPLDVPHPISV
ncbi:MAG: M20/M25/M40 family metallo-hydrolase, partial [Planctomycetaceae bacterium]|nr:M20/M25/M40 family metallo-hydrolase [Planctomycetaceae bacterium]